MGDQISTSAEATGVDSIWMAPLGPEDRRFLKAVYTFVEKARQLMHVNLAGDDSPIEELLEALREKRQELQRAYGDTDPDIDHMIDVVEGWADELIDNSTFGKQLAELAEYKAHILENRSEDLRLLDWVESRLEDFTRTEIARYRQQLSAEQRQRGHSRRLLREVFRVRAAIRVDPEKIRESDPDAEAALAVEPPDSTPSRPEPPSAPRSTPKPEPEPPLAPAPAPAPAPSEAETELEKALQASVERVAEKIIEHIENRLQGTYALTETMAELLRAKSLILRQLRKAGPAAREKASETISDVTSLLLAARRSFAEDKAVCRRIMILTNFVNSLVDAARGIEESSAPAASVGPLARRSSAPKPLQFGNRIAQRRAEQARAQASSAG